MNNSHYSDNELHLMSYQDLRRLSILMELPANIKKKYMISMIQAHQKGDGGMKTAIANKIMEERKVKRLSRKKQSKSFMLSSPENTQQIPTDLSVSAQHEFETHFSYVAHYSKDDIGSGISRIIKQEAEVSRRNRSILQQPRKSTRKLSTVGRTEIILPRNHSLTTPVRLMPQYEREFPSAGNYETMTGLSNAKNHFQDLNYNYQFHEEFSNTLMPTTSHELYRNEPYWHTKEVYNNSLMPILSSLLTPSSVTINSSSYASQYTSSNSVKGATSFQGVYENYIKNNGVIESQSFQSSATNSSALIVNNHHVLNSSSCNAYSVTRGSYLNSKEEAEFETPLTADELNCQHCNQKETTVIKNSNEGQSFLDFYSSRNSQPHLKSLSPHIATARDMPKCNNVCCTTESKDVSHSVAHRSFKSSIIAYKTTKTVNDQDDTDVADHGNVSPIVDDYESNYTEEEELWEESENGIKKLIRRSRIEKENFENGFLTTQGQKSFLSDISHASTNFSAEADSTNKQLKISGGDEASNFAPLFPRCRFTLGHNKYPESVTDSNKETDLPSFLSTFCSNEPYSRAYSVCRNSFTGTTETHLNPIMTCTYAQQFSSLTQQTQNSNSETQIQRQWCYTYPESQVSFPVDSTTWNEYSSETDSNVISPQNNPNVQIVKCRTHGCHYLYSVLNSCN